MSSATINVHNLVNGVYNLYNMYGTVICDDIASEWIRTIFTQDRVNFYKQNDDNIRSLYLELKNTILSEYSYPKILGLAAIFVNACKDNDTFIAYYSIDSESYIDLNIGLICQNLLDMYFKPKELAELLSSLYTKYIDTSKTYTCPWRYIEYLQLLIDREK